MRLRLDQGWVDLDTRRLERDGRTDVVTELEARLLAYLVSAEGRAVSRDELLGMVWGYAPTVVSRAVDKTVSRLRQKLEADPREPTRLQTAHGAGYRWVPLGPGPRSVRLAVDPGRLGAELAALDTPELREALTLGQPVRLEVELVPAARSGEGVLDALTDPTWVLRNRGVALGALGRARSDGQWTAAVRLAVELCDAFSRDLAGLDLSGLLGLLPEDRVAERQALRVRLRLEDPRAPSAAELEQIRAETTERGTAVLAARRLAGHANQAGDNAGALHWLDRANQEAERAFEEGEVGLHLLLGGRFPLVAKVGDHQPERSEALLRDTLTLATFHRHWPAAGMASALLGALAADIGRLDEAAVVLQRALPALERLGNDRVCFYFASVHGLVELALGRSADGLAPWLERAREAGSAHGQAFLLRALGCRAAATELDAARELWAAGRELGVPFATEAIELEEAFHGLVVGDSGPWDRLRPTAVTSDQAAQARGVLAALAEGCTHERWKAALPAVRTLTLWRWGAVLERA